ncbi:unnamed protein product [Phaeothamnion confervicola]
MVAIPALKFFTLTVKTAAKPMANALKAKAIQHPKMNSLLVKLGQTTHEISARIAIRAAGHSTASIKPLDEAKALARGGNILAEGVIYTIGAGLVIYEYKASNDKSAASAAKTAMEKAEETQQLQERLAAIDARLEALEKTRWGLGLGPSSKRSKNDQAPARTTAMAPSTPATASTGQTMPFERAAEGLSKSPSTSSTPAAVKSGEQQNAGRATVLAADSKAAGDAGEARRSTVTWYQWLTTGRR